MWLLLACAGPDPDDTSTPSGRFHAEGYAAPAEHGLEAKLEAADCTMCHGPTLDGAGAAGSCDVCHDTGWRTNCTFCHGGTVDETGAPPRDIDGSTTDISFSPHSAHVADTELKLGLACSACHLTPTDALSDGHIFVEDSTHGRGEVDFTGGLSPAASWTGGTGCANVYCHGSGRGDDGTVALDAVIDGCDDCHPHRDSGKSGWATMSGQHARHLSVAPDFECGDCHKAVVESWEPIAAPALHVDGAVEVQTVGSIVWDPTTGTCSGECHQEVHEARIWAP